MRPGKCDEIIAHELADYFLSKINRIRDDLVECPIHSPSSRDTEEISFFQPLIEEGVANIIISMTTKSCENDLISAHLLNPMLITSVQ